jgi:hypothetical protein
MRRLFLLGVLLVLSGCRSTPVGPYQPQSHARVDDPLLSIGEQERNGRANLALPDESKEVAPHSGAALPGTFGR